MKNKIKVLIVDDSATVRQTLAEILSSDPEIKVIATAADPFIAAERIKDEIPDVITLDVEMPRMDGITFLHKIMSQRPIPVVMCSSLTESGSRTALKAMEYGAIEIIQKPKLGAKKFFEEAKIRICDAVKSASYAKTPILKPLLKARPKLTADAVISKGAPASRSLIKTTDKIIAVGASTGGTQALTLFLQQLPHDTPGVVIVQHMPEKFTASFAERLNEVCTVTVSEAKNNATVLPGHALIAPGNFHMLLKRSGARYYVEVKEGPLVSRHRPSVDVLFRSVARYAGKNAVGIIMTGMGDDGARGMLEMKEAESFNIAQDENSCVVFGMPKEAIKRGGVDKTLPLDHIASYAVNICKKDDQESR